MDGFSSGLFLSNLWVTMQESLLGFLLALLISLPLGYALAKSRLFAVAFHPYLAAGQAIPVLALLSLWLGYGLFTNVVVSFLVVFFPLVVNAMLGLQLIDRSLTDSARVEGASGWSLLAYIEFPLALPPIMAAFRTCLTLAVVGALVAEFVIGGDQGLGSLVLQAKNQYNLPFMFASLLVLALLAALYYGFAWLLTKLTEAVF
jgi:NitT/TauT family transport system permease protein